MINICIGDRLDNGFDRVSYVKGLFEFQKLISSFRERFFIVFLGEQKEILGTKLISSNIGYSTKFDISIVQDSLLKFKPSKIILAHNHPNNEVFPSFDDILTTRKIQELSLQYDTDIEDHLIVSKKGGYFSFKENGSLSRIRHSVKSNLD